MSLYPKAINDAVAIAFRRVGLAEPSAIGVSASFECGCFVRFLLNVNSQAQIIESASFRTNGCGYLVASAEKLAWYLENKVLRDLHGLDPAELTETVLSKLGDFPDERNQCCAVAIEALTSAFATYRQKQVEEFSGEKALICTCFGVSEETIESVIRTGYLKEVSQVSDACNAGSGCGSCRMLIQEMIDLAQTEG